MNGDKESDWVYLEDGTFKTCKEEQVLVTPSTDNGDIEEKSIRISWQPCKVDRIRIYTEDASYDETIELSEADIAFGSCIISGLTQGTRYTVEIYNGETMRGSIEVMTGEARCCRLQSVMSKQTALLLTGIMLAMSEPMHIL